MKDITMKDFYEWLDTYPDNVVGWGAGFLKAHVMCGSVKKTEENQS